MNASKKCAQCRQWSSWNQNPTDRCEHCQSLLDPVTIARQQVQQNRQQEAKQRFSIDFIQINPDEPWFTRFYKGIGLGFQIAFIATISFLLWFITLLAA